MKTQRFCRHALGAYKPNGMLDRCVCSVCLLPGGAALARDPPTATTDIATRIFPVGTASRLMHFSPPSGPSRRAWLSKHTYCVLSPASAGRGNSCLSGTSHRRRSDHKVDRPPWSSATDRKKATTCDVCHRNLNFSYFISPTETKRSVSRRSSRQSYFQTNCTPAVICATVRQRRTALLEWNAGQEQRGEYG